MYIDIHVHNHYKDDDVVLLLNLFPGNSDKINTSGYYSIGLHPWYVNDKTYDNDITAVRQEAAHPNVLAVGEIGLDKKIDVPYFLQLQAFEQQLDIAEKLQKPVIIHCVKAYDDIISIRRRFNISIPWIIHWFNASEEIAAELIKYNCYLSFGQMLFKENSRAFRVFKNMNLDRAFFETDDTGVSISQVYKKAAEVRNVKVAELQKHMKINFKNCFGDLV